MCRVTRKLVGALPGSESRGCGGDERVGASLVSGGRGAGVDACTLARKEQQLQNADKWGQCKVTWQSVLLGGLGE